MPLSEDQWEIVSPDGTVGLVFGTLSTGIQTRHEPDLGQRSLRTTDAPLPREDGTGFGPDFEHGTTVTFECDVLTSSHRAQVDLLDRLQGIWRARAFRAEPEDHAILKACVAGRVRRCYGRPRRFAETDADLTRQGWTGAVFDFATIDGKFYDDIEQSVSMSLPSAQDVGFSVAPDGYLTSPITTTVSTQHVTPVTVEGEETWPVVTVHGPVTNPRVTLGDLVLELDHTLNSGESVTIDPRPWSRGVFRNDGANLAGALTWATPPLSECRLDPGTYSLTYSGNDVTGTSYVEVAWRNAHSRP